MFFFCTQYDHDQNIKRARSLYNLIHFIYVCMEQGCMVHSQRGYPPWSAIFFEVLCLGRKKKNFTG